MTYMPNIPQGTDNLSDSQSDLLTNMGQLESVFDEDHYTWDDSTAGGAYRGEHRQITAPQTYTDTSTPVPTVTPNDSILFTQTANTGGTARGEWFVANTATQATNAANVLWYGGLSSLAKTGQVQSSLAGNGYMILPSGLQIVWGKTTSVSDGQTITFAKAFPASVFTLVCGYSCNTSALGVAVGYRGSSLTTSQFTLNVSVTSGATQIDVNYVAFGN